MIRILILSTLLFGWSTLAFAQAEDGRQVKYAERTEIDFDGVEVAGEVVKPAGCVLGARRKANFNPLIRLRENFDDEMARSVDRVK